MKYCLPLIFVFIISVSSKCQQRALFNFNGWGLRSTSITGSVISYPLRFNNSCVKIQSGLVVFNLIKSGVSFTFPCVETKENIKLQLVVYPNPTSGDLVLKAQLYNNLQRNCSLKIIDGLGRIILYRTCILFDLQQGLKLNLQFASSGTYFLIINGEGVTGFTRIIKVTE